VAANSWGAQGSPSGVGILSNQIPAFGSKSSRLWSVVGGRTENSKVTSTFYVAATSK
jgi:hypothetical protein